MNPATRDVARRALALAGAAQQGIAYAIVRIHHPLPADPLELFASLPPTRTLLWDAGDWLLACGSVAEVSADGPGRGTILAAARARFAAVTVQAPSASGAPPPPPSFLTAWSFEDAPPGPSHWGEHLSGARLWLPARLWRRQADGSGTEVRAVRVQAGDDGEDVARRLDATGDPTCALPVTPIPISTAPVWPALAGDFRDQVEDATTLIRDGALKKVVLSRAVDVEAPAPHEATAVLARLALFDPSATVFAHDCAGGLFLGATPELLFTASGTRVTAMALAGSAPRGDDEALNAALLDSTKNRKEHGLVVEHLVHTLRPRCHPFTPPAAPHPRRLGSLLHWESLISAELLHDDALELLAALHPTPAVCGLPSAAAAHYLARRERLHRGLYAGVLGWLGADSRCCVPLRCGLLAPGRARLFAGAGIIETSEAEAEWAETELKFQVMRRALAR